MTDRFGGFGPDDCGPGVDDEIVSPSISTARDSIAALRDLFDALLAFPHATLATLFATEHPHAEWALRLWCMERHARGDRSVVFRETEVRGVVTSVTLVRNDKDLLDIILETT